MNCKLFLLLVLVGGFVYSCKKNSAPNAPSDEHMELLEDQAELEEAYRSQKKIDFHVFADVETEPVDAQKNDDAADDPTIWYNKISPSESLIFGSNKKGGIVSFNLKGEKINYYEVGKINNVDVIYDFQHDGRSIDILGGSNRSTQGIDLFEVSEDGTLKNLSGERFLMDTTLIDDIYGFCFGSSKDGMQYVFVNGKNGLMLQYKMKSRADIIELELVRKVQLDSQPEGMVVSKDRDVLYIGEEQKGIWILDLYPESTTKKLLPNSGEENTKIKFDIEGLTIMKLDNKEWLIASSQGNFSYAVFDIADEHKYLGSFIIAEDNIDGVQETDGIDVITDSLSQSFPKGIFMAQDGFNFNGENQEAQNFKYVDVRQIISLFE